MTIETKFNIGDEVLFIGEGKIQKEEIEEIDISIRKFSHVIILYKIKDSSHWYGESKLFSNIEELKNSLVYDDSSKS